VDDLSPQGAPGTRALRKQNIDSLVLDPKREWSRSLRGSPRDVTFVSFLAYASEGTVFEIGGATLQVKPGLKAGYAQIVLGVPAGYEGRAPSFAGLVKIERHDTASLAALPVLTLRLDPTGGTWDLYLFQRLVAADVPLADPKGSRRFSIAAGKEGAWLCGLILADENPLFVDANANGIDDAFEQQKRGSLLGAASTVAERGALIAQWQGAQTAANLKAWKIRRLVPDVVAASR